MSIEEIGGKIYDVWGGWKSRPKDYHCPVCGREKKDIVRPNKHGHIMMHIGDSGICEDCTAFRTKMRDKHRNLLMSCDDAILFAYVRANQPHEEDLPHDNP